MKLLIITGGSRGLGKQICELADKEQWLVCELSRSGTAEGSIYCDLSNSADGLELARDCISELATDEYEEIRVILNAGTVSPIGLLEDLCDDEIVNGISANITGSVLLVSHILREFKNHTGKKMIVQVSSGAALHGTAGWSLYCLAKAGMENFLRSIAEEQAMAEFPFSTLIFDPGVMDTEMQEEIRSCPHEQFPGVERFIGLKASGFLRNPGIVADLLWKRLRSPFQAALRIQISELLD